MDFFELFLGRLHPLVVHLPIGILLMAFLFELLSLHKKFGHLKSVVQLSLFIGALSAGCGCVTGYFLSLEGGYNERLITQHQYLGISTAVLSFILFFLRRSTVIVNNKQRLVGPLLFVPVMATLTITGHLGGSLTHGEEFLSSLLQESTDDPLPIKPIANVDQAVLYADVIQPILKSKCYGCHSSKKQKGDLRLDEIDFIKRGGEHGDIIVAGLPDSSTLYKLLLLPLEDERHMPPKRKPQLTSTEIAILQTWIEEGASFDKKVHDFAKSDKMKSYIASLQSARSQHWVPLKKVNEPDQTIIDVLQAKGIHILPVAQDNNYLMINFINATIVTDADLNMLLKLKDQLVWLSLEGTTISDEQLTLVSNLTNLRWLYLNNTKISDKGILSLKKLSELQFLNLVNTQVTGRGLEYLSSLKNLRKLFAYKAKFSTSEIASFHKLSPHVVIDTGGYFLPSLPTDTMVFRRKM